MSVAGHLWRLATTRWSLDPFLMVTLVVAAWHELGLRRLAARSQADRRAVRRRRSLQFYLGLATLDVAVMSPIDAWSDDLFWVHQVQHLLLMFAGPALLVAGAPWLPLIFGLPVAGRRRLGRAFLPGHRAAWLRPVGRAVAHPWVAVVAFNVNMVLWHLPAAFDLAQRDQAVHIWLMHGSFFAIGVLFWLQFIPSHPLRPALRPLAQMGALFGTNVVMFLLAVSLGLLATAPWYSGYTAAPGAALSPLGDQHLGAGILWVCGDLWCLPAFIRATRRWIHEDESGVERLADRLLRGVLPVGGGTAR